ncbi:Esa1p-associated factor, variant 2 [Balamuthia mandrillaris]
MLKYNDENKALRKKLNEEMRSTKKKRGWPKGKKRKASEMDKKTNFQLDIPLGLRKRLVKDHGFIRDKSLVPLPRTPNVADILKAYVAELKPLQFSDMTETADSTERNQEAGSSTDSNTFDEVVEGVRLYFDKALGSLLLYRFERMQFSEVFKKNKNVPPSELYGAEHLLRLFVKLPELLDGVEMEDDAKKLLAQKLNDILSYLDRNRKSLFLPEYEAATPSYRRMVE